jgi:hypothetical protein
MRTFRVGPIHLSALMGGRSAVIGEKALVILRRIAARNAQLPLDGMARAPSAVG